MNSKVQRISIKGMSRQDWLVARQQGLGGSDIGSIMGVDQYKPALKLYHQKTGFWPTDEEDNIAAYSGRVGEDHIYRHYWKYWDPNSDDEDLMLQNANSENVVRTANHIHSMLINPDYPWLIGNIDFRINKYKNMPNGILELKMPSRMHWNKYEAGLPPGYIFQIQTYMLITGYEWGELFAVMDGRYPVMFRFEKNEKIQNAIIEQTHDFWQTVLKGREIFGDKSLNMENKLLSLAEFEPDAESSKAFEDYMKDRFKAGAFDNKILSTDSIEEARVEYWNSHDTSKDWEKKKQLQKNIIMKFMGENSVDAITLEDDSMIKINPENNRLTIPKIKKNG